MKLLTYLILAVATFPFVYYLLVLYSSWRFIRDSAALQASHSDFTPPVSNLKPIRGLDPDCYENFATFCQQDYPEYEILFCVGDRADPVLPVVEKLQRDFPERRIRVFYGVDRQAANDKVLKLARLVREAAYDTLVISDSDVRVARDYLRTMVAPLANSKVGAVTCLYAPADEKTFVDRLQTIGMVSDFYPGILVARLLDGVKFALGTSIGTTKKHLAAFGGYDSIAEKPGDDLLVGRFIAEQGYEVVLLPHTVLTVADFQEFSGLVHKRMRWLVVMRHMRPWGHVGLVFTQGLAWSVAAVAMLPVWPVAAGYFGAYMVLRMAMTWLIGSGILKQRGMWRKFVLIPLWDALAFGVWLVSFFRRSIRWRDGQYYIRDGALVPIAQSTPQK